MGKKSRKAKGGGGLGRVDTAAGRALQGLVQSGQIKDGAHIKITDANRGHLAALLGDAKNVRFGVVYLAVFIHNALLPSSAGKIILNGATQSVVGKGRDEQRVSFSNLLDDIGGQELQSSEEFLLCQLRQPSSRDATAQLFGDARTRRALPS